MNWKTTGRQSCSNHDDKTDAMLYLKSADTDKATANLLKCQNKAGAGVHSLVMHNAVMMRSSSHPQRIAALCPQRHQRYHPVLQIICKNRYFGSFSSRDHDDPFYLQSLQNVLMDLRKELKLNKPPADTTLPPGLSSSSNLNAQLDLSDQGKLQEKLQELAKMGSEESLREAFQILDIVILMADAGPGAPELSDIDLSQASNNSLIVTSEILSDIMESWNKAWITEETSISPPEVLGKLKQYLGQLPTSGADMLTIDCFNHVIAASNHRMDPKEAATLSQSILNEFSQRVKTEKNRPMLRLNSQTYNLTMQLLAKAGDVRQALSLLEKVRNDKDDNEDGIMIKVTTFDILLDACLNSQPPHQNMGEMADQLLEHMIAMSDSKSQDTLRPVSRHYSQVIQCWAKSKHPKTAERIENILKDLEVTSSDDTKLLDAKPTTVMYNVFINVLAEGGRANEAEAYLELLCRRASQRPDDENRTKESMVEPNTRSFNICLKAWARLGAGKRAQELLKGMQKLSHVFQDVQPDVVSYNSVIDAWSKSKDRRSGQKARELLEKMKRKDHRNGKHSKAINLRPNTRTYTSVIHALANNGDAEEAERLLWEMLNVYRDIEPTTLTFNAVLNAIAKSGAKNAGKRAEALLKNMYDLHEDLGLHHLKPDTISYNCTIHAYGQSGIKDASEHAERLLSQMLQKSCDKGYEHLKPDSTTYGSVIHACTRAGDIDRAQQILDDMCLNYKNKETDVAPDVRCFNAIIAAHAKLGNGVEAENLLYGMRRLHESGFAPNIRPTDVTYNNVINAWAKSGNQGSGERTELLLQQMVQNGLQPDVKTVGGVLNAWTKVGVLDRPEAILEQLCQDFLSGASRIEPDAQCFNIILGGILRSKAPDAGEKADKLLQRMEQLNSEGMKRVKPDRMSYQHVLWCWQQCSRRHPKAAERIAILTELVKKFS